MKNEKYETGTTVKLKKKHPCGENNWEIIRMGMDIKLKCLKCGSIVMMSRKKFEKNIKKIIN